jgi:hypothetical protein
MAAMTRLLCAIAIVSAAMFPAAGQTPAESAPPVPATQPGIPQPVERPVPATQTARYRITAIVILSIAGVLALGLYVAVILMKIVKRQSHVSGGS